MIMMIRNNFLFLFFVQGFLMKIDTFHQIQLGSVYRGLSPVPSYEIIRLYNGLYIPRQYIRGDNYEV